jgi:glutamate-1-semialdehyde 2,1-aminomutase
MYKRQSSYQTHEQLSKTLVSGLHHNFAKVEKDIPLHFASGKGSTLIDFDGNEYLDLFARCGAMFLGHGNEEYCNTLKDAIMAPITEYSSYDEEVCQWFKKYVPCCEQIRFGLSGTEMVLNALRLARAYTGRRRIIRFNGHYHGSADNIMGGKAKGALYPIVIEDEGSVFTTKGRASGVLQDQMLLIPWNHIETFRKTIQAYGADVAAVIMEPVMINGGSIFPLPGYLEEVRDICNQHGILLIFDEIITGVHMGLGGAQAITGVTPDLCLMGKAVSGGAVPVTALMGKADIMGLYRDGNVVHGGTFNGYHLGMAAIATTFRILSRNEKKIYKHISQINKQISEIIQKEANRCELQVIVQGPPACAAFHCTDKEITCYEEITQNILEKDMIIRSCMEQYGILVYRTSRMYLNIAIEEKDIDFLQLHIRPAMEMAEKIIKRLKI